MRKHVDPRAKQAAIQRSRLMSRLNRSFSLQRSFDSDEDGQRAFGDAGADADERIALSLTHPHTTDTHPGELSVQPLSVLEKTIIPRHAIPDDHLVLDVSYQ